MIKKIITATVASTILLTGSATYAGLLSDAANTTTAVTNAVNGPAKLSIQELNSSGTKYINKQVQISGNVTAMKMDSKDSYTTTITDKSGNKVDVMTTKVPSVKLGSETKITGDYNGKAITTESIGGGLF
ncbi:hypothetical protein OAO18_08095 [Francisellaceae bacterium]|nr:hypothetical protein [Francisellaceae bacterium]